MKDAFTRRGFGRAMALGAASLWLPSIVRADDPVALRARWVQRADARRISVRLHLRSPNGTELLESAIDLVGTLLVGEARHPIRLATEFRRHNNPRSRLGFRWRHQTLPADEEIHYGSFSGSWPEGIQPQAAVLHVRARLRVDYDARPEGEHAGLRALEALRGQVRIPAVA